MKSLYTFAVLLLLNLATHSAKAQVTTVLNPVQDAYFITFGGGQGCNPILKFNISSIPPGSTISKATLEVYVYDTTNPAGFSSAMLGNMMFRNLNNKQGWQESDSAYLHVPNNNLYSDTIMQLTGFGDTIGWASSVDLKPIILKDYNAANTYCTISMKDPDDMTCCGANGPNFSSFLGDQNDSVLVGNKVLSTDEIIFYPREYTNPNLIPRLILEYTCSVTKNQNLAICYGDSVVIGGNVHNTTGIYSDTLTAVNGCDSIVTTNLTVHAPLDLTVTVQGGNVLSSLENGAAYQWLDCNNSNAPVNGETSQTYTAQANGDYAVVVTKNGCSDTSACANVSTTGVANAGQELLRVYPNPVKDALTIDPGKGQHTLTLMDVSGRVLVSKAAQGRITLDMKHESSGLYLLKISGSYGTRVVKVVKD